MENALEELPIVERDPWLRTYESALRSRYDLYRRRRDEIGQGGDSLRDYANGYLYYGFQYDPALKGWHFREWLPGAEDVYLFGDFNGWQRTQLRLRKDPDGVWSIFLPDESFGDRLVHGSLVKMLVHGANGWLERIPSYIRRVVQDPVSKNFTGQLWAPPVPFDWQGDAFDIASVGDLLIYECHVGMAQEEPRVGTYAEFTRDVLPRVKRDGYNTVQLMGIAEHPYYGSFGYHVSNFFAPSSRFGTPEELKELIRTAHGLGLGVIMDLVHSHYVKNLNEGLNELDGTNHLYSPAGPAGDHPFWDSKLFDYGKEQVRHFLLSNVKYWMEEFHFDGFRFDGVTSMIYTHHGLTEFDDPAKYFRETDPEAICYLTLANALIHELRPHAVTVAEDVSGMPGMCYPVRDGGVGFDYRLAMAVPDFWIKLLKEVPDEDWDIWRMWNTMTDRLPDVGTVAYCESHDQALVGDQTLAFRLMNKQMYTDMNRAAENLLIDRGMALHKMIRLFTISLAGQAYLNFMGNEFGHPEWIDFPREGNGWSYAHARRMWSLAENGFLRYSYLGEFDRAMLKLVRRYSILSSGYAYNHKMDTENKTVVFSHRDIVFVFNWHPDRSLPDYPIPVPEAGRYRVLMSTDDREFGGYGRIDHSVKAFSFPQVCPDGATRPHILIYNLSRSALVLKRMSR